MCTLRFFVIHFYAHNTNCLSIPVTLKMVEWCKWKLGDVGSRNFSYLANLHVTLKSGVGTFGTLTSLPGMRGTLGTDGLGTGTFEIGRASCRERV